MSTVRSEEEIVMRSKSILWIFLASLLIASLACSTPFGGDDTDVETEPDTGQVEATEVPPPVATEVPEFEEAPIDALQLWDSRDITSYKGEFIISFDGFTAGEATQGSLNMLMEMTTDPMAQHFILSLEGLDLGEEVEGFDLTDMEFYMVEDTMYANMGMGLGWLKFPGMTVDDFQDSVLLPEEFIDLPPTANRKLLPETVNGVRCWHYVIDDPSIFDETAQFETFEADAWVAVDGGYLVKLEMSATGTFSAEFNEGISLEEGSMDIVFNLLSINEPFTIELPEEALAAEDFGFGTDLLGDQEWTREDVPLPADAQIDLVMDGTVFFFTDLTVQETADFMTEQLSANGWTPVGEPFSSPDSFIGDFSKEAETLTLMINPNTEGELQTSGYLHSMLCPYGA
jgi:hypothetical protein